ncbi:MAG: transketolase family protein [Spirochaetaceae bacterium]|jgi:transketolase|nr:transketolase family protein [Spirochaetaceae bacterium]
MSNTNNETDLREKQIETLIRLKDEGLNIVYLVSDSVSTSKVKPFLARFPESVVNVGIAEQNLVGVAAGLANMDFIPFTGNAAPFLISRSAEQIKVDVGYSQANVKLNGMHAGFSYGLDGITHHEVNDISVMRGCPPLTIFAPCDGRECARMTEYAARMRGPFYMSLNSGRFPDITDITDVAGEDTRWTPGNPIQAAAGNDLTVICLGTAVHDALEAVAALKGRFTMDVFALSSIRPFVGDRLADSVRKTGRVLTVEQHSTHGGCGSLIAEMIADKGLNARLLRLGIPEGSYTKNAPTAFNKHVFGLDAAGIIRAIDDLVKLT